MNDPIRLNPQATRLGLGWAQSWTNGPILCVITPEAMRFTVVGERRFVASWEWAEDTQAGYNFFLMPSFVASTLASQSAYEIRGLRVRINRTHVALTVRDPGGEYVIQWRWRATSFEAPPFFDQMAAPPTESLEEAYVAVADAVHLAIANLGRLEATEQVDRQDLAIMVDFTPGQFKIDGQPITASDEQRYYFDPRLIVRGLEIVRGRRVGFSLSETPVPGQAILYMASQRDRWGVHCALLSLLPDEKMRVVSQRVRPVPQTDRLSLRDIRQRAQTG